MKGAIFYPAGSTSFFPKDTVVQPDNLFPIRHDEIQRQHFKGIFKIMGVMPKAFLENLRTATLSSDTMSPNQQRRLLEMLDARDF